MLAAEIEPAHRAADPVSTARRSANGSESGRAEATVGLDAQHQWVIAVRVVRRVLCCAVHLNRI